MAASKDAKSRLSGDTQPNLALLARRVPNTAVRSGSRHTVAGETPSRLGRPTTGAAADYEYQSNDIITTLQVVGQLQAEQERS